MSYVHSAFVAALANVIGSLVLGGATDSPPSEGACGDGDAGLGAADAEPLAAAVLS